MLIMAPIGALLFALAASPDEEPVNCTCVDWMPMFDTRAFPINALHVLQHCERGKAPLDQLRVRVDGRVASIRVEPEYSTERDLAFRIDPEPVEGERVTIGLCHLRPCHEPSDYMTFDYIAGPRDVDPPTNNATPRIELSPLGGETDVCNRYPKVLVRLDGIDLSTEPATYAHVRMVGHGVARPHTVQLLRATENFEGLDYVAAEIDAYTGRWCAEVTLLDAAGNARDVGSDCVNLDCRCDAGRGGPVPLLLVLGALAVRRGRARHRRDRRRSADWAIVPIVVGRS